MLSLVKANSGSPAPSFLEGSIEERKSIVSRLGISKINRFAHECEIFFNKADSIPIVAILGSVLRIGIAKVQLVASVFFAFGAFVGLLFQPSEKGWELIFEASVDHMGHGSFNMIRGFGEFLLAMTVVGSLIPLIYQSTSENGFNPIFDYENCILDQVVELVSFQKKDKL